MASGFTKHRIEKSVYEAALERIHLLYERFDKICVGFSAGKDSGVALELTLKVAKERNLLPLDVWFSDGECITFQTVEFAERTRARDNINFKWVCLPVKHRNACSRSQPYWYPWLAEDKEKWVRPLPPGALTIDDVPDFRMGMGVSDIGSLLYGHECGSIAEVRGIRADESIRRLNTVTRRTVDNWICQNPLQNYYYPCSPIYDFTTLDIWASYRQFGWDYNATYDLLSLAGVPPSQQRVTPPFGEEPLNKLWNYAVCFPELWSKMIERVDGVGTAARYAKTDLYGAKLKEPPPGMTWKSWCYSLLDLYPPDIKKQVAGSIVEYIRCHQSKTSRPIPEVESDPASGVSWKWLCQIINRGDLKGRKQQSLVNKALMVCAKLGITPEEALRDDLPD